MNLTILKYCIIFLFISICCTNSNYSLVVIHPRTGSIIINDKPLEAWVIKKNMISDNEELYFLDIARGKYKIKIKLLDETLIDTSFVINSGEAYLSVNLKSGTLSGF